MSTPLIETVWPYEPTAMSHYYSGEHWDHVYGVAAPETSRAEEAMSASVASAIGELSGLRGLDLGTGDAHLACELAQRGAQIDAVDMCGRALAEARTVVRRERLEERVALSQMDTTDLQFEDGRFDFATCIKTLYI